MNEGGVDKVYSLMAAELGAPQQVGNARISGGCTVNWRNVWAGAVISGTVGAVGGLKIGLAGGTVILPGIGSATGAVGGAVLAGANGFIGGTLVGVAGELLTSCFRNVQSVDAICEQALNKFVNGEISAVQIPEECIHNLKIELIDINF